MVNPKPILRLVCEAFDIKDVNSVIPPDPTPEELVQIQQQQAMAQQQQMQMAQEQQAQASDQQQQAAGQQDEAHQLQQLKTVADIISKVPPEVLQGLLGQLQAGGIANS